MKNKDIPASECGENREYKDHIGGGKTDGIYTWGIRQASSSGKGLCRGRKIF